MRPETAASLADIRRAIEDIRRLAGPNAERFQDDAVGLAVERLLEIIGEALTRIRGSDETVFAQVPYANRIVGLRNALAHGYDQIDQARIRDYIVKDLPELSEATNRLLDRA